MNPSEHPTTRKTGSAAGETHRKAKNASTLGKQAKASRDAAPIAIVGMACRFPKAPDYNRFWQNLVEGSDAIEAFPPHRWDPDQFFSKDFKTPNRSHSKWCGLLDDIDRFDHRFFGISPREARNMDPQQRLLLEETWRCLEDAGIPQSQLQKGKTGVFVGVMAADYQIEASQPDVSTDGYSALGNYQGILANRISHTFGFDGPSFAVGAACASSLVALHEAKAVLNAGRCRYALAAGVSLNFKPWKNISFSKARMLSPAGRCATFDADADGYVPGEGVAVLLLQPLADALAQGNHIHGVLAGSAVNHNGGARTITAPSLSAQRDVILDAYRDAGFTPDTVTYVEAHGTGTSLGDPIEVEALTRAFRRHTRDKNFCKLGSVKTNIGHLEAAAGLAGVIKVLLMMAHRRVVPTLNLKTPNPIIQFRGSPFSPALKGGPFRSRRRGLPLRAGVSSFGFGGVNAHVLLQAPPRQKPKIKSLERGLYPFVLSAKSPSDLSALIGKWRSFSQTEQFGKLPLEDGCATLCTGRIHHPFRVGFWPDGNTSPVDFLKNPGPTLQADPKASWCLRVGNPSRTQLIPALIYLLDQPAFAKDLGDLLALWSQDRGLLPTLGKSGGRKLFLTAVVQTILNSLKHWGFHPDSVTGEGLGLAPALVHAGLLAPRYVPQLLLGKPADTALQLQRPKVPFFDPVSRKTLFPFYVSGAYLQRLVEEIDLPTKVTQKLFQKAVMLRQKQHTFKRFLEAWEALIQSRGLRLESLLSAGLDSKKRTPSPRDQLLLAVMLGDAQRSMERRWDLDREADHESERFEELLDLLQDGLLPRQVLVDLLCETEPQWDLAAASLNQSEGLPHPKKPYALLVEMNQTLFEIEEPVAWYQKVQRVTSPPLNPKQRQFVELGSLKEPADHAVVDSGDDPLRSLLLGIWLAGGPIDWQREIPSRKIRRVPLPTYPFHGERFWITDKKDPQPDSTLMGNVSGDPLNDLFLTPIWKREDKKLNPGKGLGNTLLIHGGQTPNLVEALKRSNPQLLEIELVLGTSPWEKVTAHESDSRYWVPQQISLDAFKACPFGLDGLQTVIFLSGYGPVQASAPFYEIEKAVAMGPMALFCTFALLRDRGLLPEDRGAFKPALVALTCGVFPVFAAEKINPFGAGIAGFLQTVAREIPGMAINCVDLERAPGGSPGKSGTNLLLEISAEKPQPGCRVSAYRNGCFYRRHLVPLTLPPAQSIPFRHNGVYLIVGGGSGIGFQLARFLARQVSARLILVGRRPMDATLKKALGELENQGGQAIYVAGDLTQIESLQAAKDRAVSKFGNLHGVFHSAVVFNETRLNAMGEANFRRVLAPKTIGAAVLARVFGSSSLDFMTFFSTIGSLTDVPGYSHYAAASTFADTFAAHLNDRLPYPVYVVNWGFWNIGVMGGTAGTSRISELGVRPLQPSEGMEALCRIQAGPPLPVAPIWLEPHMRNLLGIDPQQRLLMNPGPVIKTALPKPGFPMSSDTQSALRRFLQTSQALDQVACRRLLALLKELGILGDDGNELEARTSKALVAPAHQKLVSACVALLSDVDPLSQSAFVRAGDQLLVENPEIAGLWRLLRTCMDGFADVISGKTPATEVLFPQGSSSLVQSFYAGNPTADQPNRWLAETAAQMAAATLPQLPEGQKYRILEVGAGTGSTTQAVLKALAPHGPRLDYVYTDVSLAFTRHGAQRFADVPFLQFRAFDAEKHPSGQNLDGFHLVIATNVLHATRRLRQTLANLKALLPAGGCLLINELTRPQPLTLCTFGLLEGWWRFQDGEDRLPHAPLLDQQGWCRILGELGFGPVFPSPAHGEMEIPQQVFLGVSNGLVPLAENPIVVQPKETTQPHSVDENQAQPEPKPTHTALLLDVIFQCLAQTLETESEGFDPHAPFVDLGVDSILAVEIAQNLEQRLGVNLRSTDLFNYPNPTALAEYLVRDAGYQPPLEKLMAVAPVVSSPAPRPQVTRTSAKSMDIAVIGMSGRFPGAANVTAFWENLAAGRNSVVEVPPHRWPLAGFFDPNPGTANHSISKWGGFLEDVDRFDPLFFNLSPLEAERMDPQQRLFLMEAWCALEDAGYSPDRLADTSCGVYVGTEDGDYKTLDPNLHGHTLTSQSPAILAARMAYLLDLKGPCLPVNTGCSSALVATHLACEALRSGACSMALAGGVAVLSTPRWHIALSQSGMLSPNGRCASFDAAADGFVPGEAVAALVLKPLSDAQRDGDPIHGVIKGSGINQDGKTNGITAPNGPSQVALLRGIYRDFAIDPATIATVETHGTGTPLGDPIEVDALNQVFGPHASRGNGIAIGSVKTNVGHTLAAAGMAGLFKLILSLKHRQLAPSLHFQKANPHLNLEDTPFFVNSTCRQWQPEPNQPRRGAVSSFGFSGTNAHVVVEEAPQPVSHADPSNDGWMLIPVSARTEADYRRKLVDLAAFLEREQPHLKSIAATLILGRATLPVAGAFLVRDTETLARSVKAAAAQEQTEGYLPPLPETATNLPQAVLRQLSEQLKRDLTEESLTASQRHEKLEAMGGLFTAGFPVDLAGLARIEGSPRTRYPPIPLPGNGTGFLWYRFNQPPRR